MRITLLLNEICEAVASARLELFSQPVPCGPVAQRCKSPCNTVAEAGC